MDTKLTLRLNSSVIEKAKEYARDHDISLSELIENYLQAITLERDKGNSDISPLVKSLTGVIELNDESYKKKYSNYLADKCQ
ncbi:MAG: hypothetical protein IPL46_02205 [Saprospiraceae bacterium]|nr:hypothetical protein [Saprospiraceae bacterium]